MLRCLEWAEQWISFQYLEDVALEEDIDLEEDVALVLEEDVALEGDVALERRPR